MTQTLQKETAMAKLSQDYILCSYLWNGITKDSLTIVGMPVFDTPPEDCVGPHGEPIEVGVIEHWNNEARGIKRRPGRSK
jgi:hypothetical protein